MCGAWVAFTLPTTSWLGWNAAIAAKYSADVRGYQRIAEAAPGLPAKGVLLPQHAQHFAPHYLAGLLADASGIPLHAVYRILAFAALGAIALAVDRLLVNAGVSFGSYTASMGVLLTSPYLFRFDALAPGMLQDATFALGATLTLLGLVRLRTGLAALGLATAVAGRGDSALVLVVSALVWVALVAGWRERRLRAGLVMFAASAATAIATFAISQQFAGSGDVQGIRSFTIVGTIAALPGSVGKLGSHVARLFVGITGPTALAAGALLVAGLARRRLPTPTLPSLLFAAAIVGEAFALNPDWLQGSQPRLSSFAVGPLTAGAGLVLGGLEAAGAWSWTPRSLALVCAAIAIASLHHHYAVLRPASTAAGFFVLEVACTTAILAPFARRAAALRAGRRSAESVGADLLGP